MTEDEPTIADVLADMTGRDRDTFDASDKPLPELDDLESIGAKSLNTTTVSLGPWEIRDFDDAHGAVLEHVSGDAYRLHDDGEITPFDDTEDNDA